jgi:hypothetical protein
MKRTNTTQLLTVALLLLAPLLMGDTGPKPSADFELIYEINPIPDVVNASLYDCNDPLCEDAFLLEELGPQGFRCTQYECDSLAYGYRDYLFILLDFSDGVTRQSNIFTKKHFSATYRVTVRAADLLVEETGGSGNPFEMVVGAGLIAVVCLGVLAVGVVALVIVLIVRASRKWKTTPASSEEALAA